jgi:hypothetical protein
MAKQATCESLFLPKAELSNVLLLATTWWHGVVATLKSQLTQLHVRFRHHDQCSQALFLNKRLDTANASESPTISVSPWSAIAIMDSPQQHHQLPDSVCATCDQVELGHPSAAFLSPSVISWAAQQERVVVKLEEVPDLQVVLGAALLVLLPAVDDV